MRATKGSLSALALGGMLTFFFACVGDDPKATNADADASPDGAVGNDAPSGPGADASAEATTCTSTCADANTLQRCNAAATATEPVACSKGCVEKTAVAAAHCKHVAPTGIVPADDFDTVGTKVAAIGTTTLHSDTGEIEGVRPASTDPKTMSVANGIGFHTVKVGTSTVGIFVFDSLTLNGKLTMTGAYPVVLLSKGAVAINAIDAAGNCGGQKPGPGGFLGGTPAAPLGAGPGGGKAGDFNGTYHAGGGGAGHGHNGGKGGSVSTAVGGSGGGAYGDETLAALIGGSGGGADDQGTANGGAGGGAIQIVSETSITVSVGIAAGGCGGLGMSNYTCGGGGSGGAILLEAPTVSVGDNAYLVTGGGGGGGSSQGTDGAPGIPEATYGLGAYCDLTRCGGNGGSSVQMLGADGKQVTVAQVGSVTGCGGGATGRIRINTTTGAATLSAVGTLYVPTLAALGSAGEHGLSQGSLVIK